MKQVLESHWRHLVTKIYKATILFKTFWKFFCVFVLPFALPFQTGGSLRKNPGQYTKARMYHGRLKNMYQAHKTGSIPRLMS